jgi:lysophospholipase L1-like esterase
MLDSPTLLGSVLARQPVDIRINAIGFRESSALGDAQIMALGDSFTFGWGVSESESWPESLEQELETTVYNLGVHDASPKQELELLKYVLGQHGDKIRMKTLLWMIYEGNDLEDDYSEQVVRHDKPVAVPLFKGTVVESAEDLVKTVREQSVIARLRRGQLSWSKSIQKTSGTPFSVDGVDLVYPLYISEKLGPRLFYQYYVDLAGMPASYVETHWNRRALEAVFDEMRKLAESHEFEVAVIFAPTAARLHGPYFTDFPEVSERAHFLELVRHLSVAAGFSFVDLYELMRPYASAELLYFRDDDHFNQRGHALAGGIIARELFRSKQ